VLKPQDLLVVLKFASLSREGSLTTFAGLAQSLFMSTSEVFAATKRGMMCHLLVENSFSSPAASRFRPIALNLREFMIGGLRYVFPTEPGKPARGFRTAQDAAPLATQISRQPGDMPFVSPHPDGDTRGFVIKPIFRSAPDAARLDERLARWLALTDALRIGDARVRNLATAEVDRLVTELDHVRI
jgi:hypothetical protein